MNVTIAAPRGAFGMRTAGAFPRAKGGVCLEGIVGTGTDTGVPVVHAVTLGAVGPAAGPVFVMRKRVAPAVWRAGQALSGQPLSGSAVLDRMTVRTHYNYTTRVIANGDDAPGPHRRRVPV
ncbi:MAG TPA: hypothetical protein VKD26_01755 [Streptosporangiaceae bacterium]|nr:hypothetical protein [Streptosporangiaceae bacterium]